MVGLDDFEQAALDKLLAGDHPVLETLRQQSGRARLARREYTGVGFFCEFEVDSHAPTAKGNFHIGDVQADLEDLAHGAGLVLFIRGGRLSMLEGYTFDEPWPSQVHRFSLKYSDPERKAQLAKLG